MYHEIDYDDDSSNVLELAYRGVVVDLRLKSGDCCYEYKSDSNQNRLGIFSRNLDTKLEPGPPCRWNSLVWREMRMRLLHAVNSPYLPNTSSCQHLGDVSA